MTPVLISIVFGLVVTGILYGFKRVKREFEWSTKGPQWVTQAHKVLKQTQLDNGKHPDTVISALLEHEEKLKMYSFEVDLENNHKIEHWVSSVFAPLIIIIGVLLSLVSAILAPLVIIIGASLFAKCSCQFPFKSQKKFRNALENALDEAKKQRPNKTQGGVDARQLAEMTKEKKEQPEQG